MSSALPHWDPYLTASQSTSTVSTPLTMLEIFSVGGATLKTRAASRLQKSMKQTELALPFSRCSPEVQVLVSRGFLSACLLPFLWRDTTFHSFVGTMQRQFSRRLVPSAGRLWAKYKLCTQARWPEHGFGYGRPGRNRKHPSIH